MIYYSSQSNHFFVYVILHEKKLKHTQIQSSSPFSMVGTKTFNALSLLLNDLITKRVQPITVKKIFAPLPPTQSDGSYNFEFYAEAKWSFAQLAIPHKQKPLSRKTISTFQKFQNHKVFRNLSGTMSNSKTQ